jgi:hypothetical protein
VLVVNFIAMLNKLEQGSDGAQRSWVESLPRFCDPL